MKELKKPFIGVAYYPEDWPESEMDYDIAKMKELGISVARIGEFAWKKMEPEFSTLTGCIRLWISWVKQVFV